MAGRMAGLVFICVAAFAPVTAQTAVDDFERYGDNTDLRGVWSQSIAWSEAFLAMNDGAEGTTQSLRIHDAGYSMGLVAPSLASPPSPGYYKLAFFYTNGQEGEPWPDLTVLVSQAGSDLCSTVRLNDTPTTIWTPGETSAAHFTVDPITVQILSRGITTHAGNFSCAFDEIRLIEIPCIPNTLDVSPPETWMLSGAARLEVSARGNCGTIQSVAFDIGDDGSAEYTDTESPFECVWSTARWEPGRGTVKVAIRALDDVAGEIVWRGSYEVDNRCLGRSELAFNGDFSLWQDGVPIGWVDFRRNLAVTIGPGEGRNTASSPSLRANFPAVDFEHRYSVRHRSVRNDGGVHENHQVAYWGKGDSNRIYYYVSRNGTQWLNINKPAATVNGPTWTYVVGPVEPLINHGQNEWAMIATHQFSAGEHFWDDIHWQTTYIHPDLLTSQRIDDFEPYRNEDDLAHIWTPQGKDTGLTLDRSEATTVSIQFLHLTVGENGPWRAITLDEAGGATAASIIRPRNRADHQVHFRYKPMTTIPRGVEVSVRVTQHGSKVLSTGPLPMDVVGEWVEASTDEGLLDTDPITVEIRVGKPVVTNPFELGFDRIVLEQTGATLEPTPSPTPSPTPRPKSPDSTVAEQPGQSEGQFRSSDVFSAPQFGIDADRSRIHLRAENNVSTFGYWEGPSCVMIRPWETPSPGAMGVVFLPGETTRLRIDWRASSDQTNQSLCPQIRFRATSENLHRTDELVVESSGAGEFSPPPGGRTYTMVFAPNEPSAPFLPAFDLLNFNPRDAAGGEIVLEGFEVQALLDSEMLPMTTERVFDFAEGTAGWTLSDSCGFDAVEGMWSAENGGSLRLSPGGSASAFGFWSVEVPAFTVEPGRVCQARFRVRSSVTADQTGSLPSFRFRVNDSANQACALARVSPRPGCTGALPTRDQTTEYEIDFAAPEDFAGRGVTLSFDLLSFDGTANLGAEIQLERVELLSGQAPGSAH